MLIKSLCAVNFRKYKNLSINDIPERGVIAVSGANESGKTSIGEAICFALFGRTFVLAEENSAKLILWGQERAEVSLSFIGDDDQEYLLTRHIEKNNDSAGSDQKLVTLKKVEKNKDADDGKMVFTGQQDVAEALDAIIGFDYSAFSNSFYLVQRELTAPDPNSHTIKQMAGIGDYARITDEVVAATKESKNTLQEVNPQCAELEAQIAEINLDETWLPELIDGAETLESERRDKARLVTELKEGAGLYAENAKPFKTARRLRGFFGLLSWVLLPLVISSWIIWAVLKYSPETLMGLISSDFADLMSSFSQWANNWLLLTAILATLGFIISLIIKLTSSKKMRHLNMAANNFGKHLNNGYRHVTTDVETLLPERVVQLAQERSKKSQTLLILPPREQFSNIGQLVEATDGYQADSEEILAAVGRVDDVLKKQQAEIKNHSAILQADIDTEKERSDAAGELRAQLLRLNKVVSVCEHNIKVQDTSLKMLKRAAEDSIKAFNANIAKTSAKTLPKFTEGRYHKVKIDEDLKVQVFSDEKEGYMDFDEISSGTQRQIMLALRMAMSAELAKNTGNEKQFIFLDEPFAFFDQWRTKSTLKALPDVSDVITQVWVVAQEFPDNADVKKIIECPLDEETLSV